MDTDEGRRKFLKSMPYFPFLFVPSGFKRLRVQAKSPHPRPKVVVKPRVSQRAAHIGG